MGERFPGESRDQLTRLVRRSGKLGVPGQAQVFGGNHSSFFFETTCHVRILDAVVKCLGSKSDGQGLVGLEENTQLK